jgi:ABC-type multidrug transport system ATPase subunit
LALLRDHLAASPALRVENITKRYGRLTALGGVSFSIRPGEILGLIGPNGSGKTTLFECLGGVLPADSGRLAGPDRPLSRRERAATLFYLPDGITPWPSQPLGWAIDFTIGFFGGRHDLRQEVVRRLGLEQLVDTPLGALSKGQRKRALLAIGLLTPHPVLLADEPFDGLDLRQTREVAQTLRWYAAAGRTMLLSIHQISDAARICDRFVLLSNGRVCGEGTIEELSVLAAASGRFAHRGAASGNLEEIFLALT